MTTSSEMQWYIVQTYSGYENKAKQSLEEHIRLNHREEDFGEIFIPTETVTEIRNGKKRQMTRKLYNGYIFVQMFLNDHSWHIVKDTPKIVGFVGDSRNPPPMSPAEIANIRSRMEEGETTAKPAYSFQQGDKVRVIEGNFKDFTGTIEDVNEEKEKLRVFVEIFGRPTSVEFDFEQVTTVEE